MLPLGEAWGTLVSEDPYAAEPCSHQAQPALLQKAVLSALSHPLEPTWHQG